MWLIDLSPFGLERGKKKLSRGYTKSVSLPDDSVCCGELNKTELNGREVTEVQFQYLVTQPVITLS